jgi:hypothetical protein
MGGLEQASPTNAIFLSTPKIKARWRTVATLALGSRPGQGLVKVQAKNEA